MSALNISKNKGEENVKVNVNIKEVEWTRVQHCSKKGKMDGGFRNRGFSWVKDSTLINKKEEGSQPLVVNSFFITQFSENLRVKVLFGFSRSMVRLKRFRFPLGRIREVKDTVLQGSTT